MNLKTAEFISKLMDEKSLLKSRLDDLIAQSKWDSCAYMGFLNEVEASFTKSYLSSLHLCYNLYGGFDAASRVFVSICNDDYSAYDIAEFPIVSLIVNARDEAILSHRDYLGSLMGLGIKRECIGDIVSVSPSQAVIFVRKDISSYILSELTSVGREKVEVTEYLGSTDSLCTKTEEITCIVSSLRIDNVVSSLCKVSRNEAVKFIDSDLVFINYIVPSKTSKVISFGDTISIRGYGKYKIVEQINTTKRDRLVLSILHYI